MQSKYKPSNRIKAIVAQAKQLKDHYESMADIGTDHGYLPRLMLEKSLVDRCILCDINEDPLKNASTTFDATAYLDQVSFRLGSGIEPLMHSEVELVVVAGMGGGLILEILSQDFSKTKDVPYLILQPQTEQNLLREWLITQQFNDIIINNDTLLFIVFNENIYLDHFIIKRIIGINKHRYFSLFCIFTSTNMVMLYPFLRMRSSTRRWSQLLHLKKQEVR